MMSMKNGLYDDANSAERTNIFPRCGKLRYCYTSVLDKIFARVYNV